MDDINFSYSEITTPKSLIRFAEDNEFDLFLRENVEVYKLFGSKLKETLTFRFNGDFELIISDKTNLESRYVIRDWDGVEMCLSNQLKVKIADGKLFLSKV